MTVLAALNIVLGAGLWFLGFRLLFAGAWKDKLTGLAILAVGTALATSGTMMIAEWGR